MIYFFAANGRGAEAEELADEVFNRVDHKLAGPADLASGYRGEPARYYFGVAKNVLKEALKPAPVVQFQQPEPPDESDEIRADCLDECLEEVPKPWGPLLLEYHKWQGSRKIQFAIDQSRQIQSLSAQLSRGGGSSPSVVSLTAGSLRSGGETRETTVRPGAPVVELRLDLHVDARGYERYLAELIPLEEETALRTALLRPQTEGETVFLSWTLPGGDLKPGSYRIQLLGIGTDPSRELLGRYGLRVAD